jgi:hypothetical protein
VAVHEATSHRPAMTRAARIPCETDRRSERFPTHRSCASLHRSAAYTIDEIEALAGMVSEGPDARMEVIRECQNHPGSGEG